MTALSTAGFTDISMTECLMRFHEVTTNVPLPPISSAIDNLREQDAKKEDRRKRQIAISDGRKRKLDEVAGLGEEDDTEGTGTDGGVGGTGTSTPDWRQVKQTKLPPRKKGGPVPFGTTVSRPVSEARGHTSYLTFATLLPVGLRGGEEEVRAEEGGDALKIPGADKGEDEVFDDGMDQAIGAMSEEVRLQSDPDKPLVGAHQAEQTSSLACRTFNAYWTARDRRQRHLRLHDRMSLNVNTELTPHCERLPLSPSPFLYLPLAISLSGRPAYPVQLSS